MPTPLIYQTPSLVFVKIKDADLVVSGAERNACTGRTESGGQDDVGSTMLYNCETGLWVTWHSHASERLTAVSPIQSYELLMRP